MGTSVENVEETRIADSLIEAATQIQAAADAKKCWACGCLRHALDAIDRGIPEPSQPSALVYAMASAKAHLVPQRYECLGCDVCYPAVALNALGHVGGYAIDAAVCPTEAVETREGWPPLPGSYRVLRYHAPVAVCTLNSEELVEPLANTKSEAIAIAGTLQTENLGIERLVTNVLANPFIRFVVVCGADSRQMIGHLPGQSLVALAREGVATNQRIIGAKGKRPVLRNLEPAAIDHFRRTVEMIDLVGVSDLERITAAVRGCAERNPGVSDPFAPNCLTQPVIGSVPEKMISDPAGYFVIFIDRVRGLLNVEHYKNNGVLTTIIEGRSAAEVYTTAIERALLSRLDHAAYLGRELARAEYALRSGESYVQDAAPERTMLSPMLLSWMRYFRFGQTRLSQLVL
jgi:tetrahydromethanopterin S-methyltransferase subunit A